jgi:hypothetical protein
MDGMTELRSDQPVDADELRQALAGMRDALGDAQREIQALTSRLEEAERRGADLEAAVAEQPPTSSTSRAGFRGLVRSARRAIARLAVRRVPSVILPYVWHNPLFEADWYRERYPDVRASRLAPERHYRRHGVAEGRDPGPYFDTSWYLAHYPDVASGRMDPLDHYHLFGAWEGRDPGPLFRTRWYLALNPDVREAGIDPLLHYVRHGAHEGRLPRPPRRAGASAAAPTGVQRPRHMVVAASVRARSPRQGHGTLTRGRPVLLVIDDRFPRTDRDAGSVLMQQYVHLFQDLGYHVHYVATQDDRGGAPYRRALIESGASALDASADPSLVSRLLEAEEEVFDPNLHEALAQMEDEKVPAGRIGRVLQKGYRLRDRLLRPARVMVSKGPGEPPQADEGSD